MKYLFNGRELGHHTGVARLLIDQVLIALREAINLGLAFHSHGFGLSQTYAERRIAVLGGTRAAHNPRHQETNNQANQKSHKNRNDIHGIQCDTGLGHRRVATSRRYRTATAARFVVPTTRN